MNYLSTIKKGLAYPKELLQVFYIRYLRPTLEKLAYKEETTSTTLLTYQTNGRTYKVLFNKPFVTPLVFKARSNKRDVTNELLSFLGPSFDFHNQKYSPAALGLTNLTINVDGTEYPFKNDELIIIPE